MAPAIAHFLVGASLLLFVVLIPFLRYEFPAEHTLWAVPIGGIWGVVPDFHHIAPGYNDMLYSFHRSPWAEVFALHYTLDQPGIRAQYHESIFVSIAVFTIAIASFWIAARYWVTSRPADSVHERVVFTCGATLIAAGLAIVAFGTVISIQLLIPPIAASVGMSGVFTGWGIIGAWGVAAGFAWTGTIEAILSPQVSEPIYSAGVGCVIGMTVWLGSAVIIIPVLTGQPAPVLHWGGLAALLTYGLVFGTVYSSLRGTFLPSAT